MFFFDSRLTSYRQRQFQAQLESRKLVKPKLTHQLKWARTFAPTKNFDVRLGAWKLLQDFTLPLILENASQAHLKGIPLLNLDASEFQGFDSFSHIVNEHTGWKLKECYGELLAEEYFNLLSQKIFPCIPELRPARGVLCNDRPDFWHEAVGHISPLSDPEVSKLYQSVGLLFRTLTEAGDGQKLKLLEKLLWVLLEYGFIQEEERWKTFGAAVSSSFVALTKWRENQWAIHDFDPAQVLESGLFDSDLRPRRDDKGRIIFYGTVSYAETYLRIEEFVLKTNKLTP